MSACVCVCARARTFVCLSRKANSFIDEVESWNWADLQRDHPNQRRKSETRNILPRGPEIEDGNAMFNLYGWTHNSYMIQIETISHGVFVGVLKGDNYDSETKIAK
jgi:hypothetical protein